MKIQKSYYSSIKTITLLPSFVFFGHIIYKNIFGEDSFNIYMIDKIFHFIGGISISISSAGILWNLTHKNIIKLHDKIVFLLLVFGTLCFVIISWEIYEYFFLYPMEHMTYDDLIIDMIYGLIGGIISVLFLIKVNYES